MNSLACIEGSFLAPPDEHPKYVGVYALIKRGEIVYVGRTTDLLQRIRMHRSQRVHRMRKWRYTFDRVLWLPLAREQLAAHEAVLIRAFAPVLNRRVPPVPKNAAQIADALGLDLEHPGLGKLLERERRVLKRAGEQIKQAADWRRKAAARAARRERRRVLATGAWLARQLAGIES